MFFCLFNTKIRRASGEEYSGCVKNKTPLPTDSKTQKSEHFISTETHLQNDLCVVFITRQFLGVGVE